MPHSHPPYDDVGSGPAIVLLHGFPFDRSMWREQIDFLSANGYRVVAPDLRGLGAMSDKLQFVVETDHATRRQAEACRTITTMEDMARDVVALMDELKIDRAIVCGLSMGGYVAFDFVHLFPSRVRGLILAGTRAPADNEQEKQVREQQAQRMLNEGMDFVADATLSKLLAARTLAEKPSVVARVREMVLSTDSRGAAAAQRGMAARRDYSADLAKINVPTLIVAGREDGVRTPEDAEFIHRNIQDSQLLAIDDAGHLMNMEQPETFNRAMLDFLGQLIH